MTDPLRGGYFARRWRGAVPARTLLWRDMVGVGTAVNLAASVTALAAASQGLEMATAVALHFAPLPYNLFLFAALWRLPGRTLFTSGVAITWLVAMVLA